MLLTPNGQRSRRGQQSTNLRLVSKNHRHDLYSTILHFQLIIMYAFNLNIDNYINNELKRIIS